MQSFVKHALTIGVICVAASFASPVYAASDAAGAGVSPVDRAPATQPAPSTPTKTTPTKPAVPTKVPPGCKGIEGTPGCGFLDDVPGVETAGAVIATVDQVSKECGLDPFCALGGIVVNGLAGLGGVIVKAIGSIFSMKNTFYVLSMLAWFTLMVAQIFMGFAAWWLDGSVYYTMVLMGYFINHKESAAGIQFVWALIRDLTNVLIIGGFVAVGISTILQVSQYAADKFLSRLIIAALLVNFSYFISGAIIDSANYIGIQIYNSDLIQNHCPENSAKGTVTGPIRLATLGLRSLGGDHSQVCGFARALVGYTAMTSWDKIKVSARGASGINTGEGKGLTVDLYDPKCFVDPGAAGCAAKSDPSTNYYFMLTMLSIMGAAFAFLLGWVFMKAALYFIARFAILIILLVTSPLGVGGSGVPFIGQFTGRWWQALVSQAVFAPLFLFLIGVSLTTVKQFSKIFAGDGKIPIADAFFAVQHTGGQGIFTSLLPIFITYFLAVVFMYVSYMISSQVANSVSEFKGIYDLAGKQADRLFKTPLTTAQRFVGTPLQAGAEALAARGIWGGRGASVLLQYGNEFMTGKKREGSVGDEVNKRIDEKIDNRYAGGNDQLTRGGWFKPAPLWNKNGRSQEQTDALEHDGKTLTPAQLRQKYGIAGVNEMAKQGLISPETLQKVRDSNAYSKGDKKQITEGYFSDFISAMNKAKETGSSEHWQKAAEKFDNMTDLERELLLTERKELRAETEFYSRLKSDSFNGLIKGQDKPTQDKMRGLRQDALVLQLNNVGGEKEGRDILKRMSNDEKAKLDIKTVTHLADKGALSAADARHIHDNGTDDVREFLKNHPKYKNMLAGTGVPTPPPPPPGDKAGNAKEGDKK